MRRTLALLSLIVMASAQAGEGPPAGKPGGARVDANKDGIVTREEAQTHPRLSAGFDAADTNRDGQLDAAEMSAHREAMHAEMRVRADARWKAADTDGDGSLSREEAQASMPRVAERFDEFDANADGRVGREEMHQYRSREERR